ncbi:MAG: transposase [Candidatus Acidiferrales bacterium]
MPAYLSRRRWPEGFRCPRCGGSKSWPVRGVLPECGSCGCQTSVTAGTIFQDPARLCQWGSAPCGG